MVKVVYNAGKGNFILSDLACERLGELFGARAYVNEMGVLFTKGNVGRKIPRHDPRLVQVVEELEEDANGYNGCKLQIEYIRGQKYRIETVNGSEVVHTPEEEKWIDADEY